MDDFQWFKKTMLKRRKALLNEANEMLRAVGYKVTGSLTGAKKDTKSGPEHPTRNRKIRKIEWKSAHKKQKQLDKDVLQVPPCDAFSKYFYTLSKSWMSKKTRAFGTIANVKKK